MINTMCSLFSPNYFNILSKIPNTAIQSSFDDKNHASENKIRDILLRILFHDNYSKETGSPNPFPIPNLTLTFPKTFPPSDRNPSTRPLPYHFSRRLARRLSSWKPSGFERFRFKTRHVYREDVRQKPREGQYPLRGRDESSRLPRLRPRAGENNFLVTRK